MNDLDVKVTDFEKKKKKKKFLVKAFRRLDLLNLWMEVEHTSPDVRYWSEV